MPGNLIYLEQYPAEGLWGGLWSPPQREADAKVDHVLCSLGIDPNDVERTHVAPSFRHTFTHFHLEIEPLYAYLRTTMPLHTEMPAQTGKWVSASNINAGREPIGLCKPAVTLVASLKDTFD